MLWTGIDIIEIDRIDAAIHRFGDRFLNRIFTDRELEECTGSTASLAARFAMKEAVAKALRTGFGAFEWRDVEVIHGASKEPVLVLHREAEKISKNNSICGWSISISHAQHYAVAFAVAWGS